jgi:hypothetical protein
MWGLFDGKVSNFIEREMQLYSRKRYFENIYAIDNEKIVNLWLEGFIVYL